VAGGEAYWNKLAAEHNVSAWVVVILGVLDYVLAQALVIEPLQCLLQAAHPRVGTDSRSSVGHPYICRGQMQPCF
jgi:hypothetical protein